MWTNHGNNNGIRIDGGTLRYSDYEDIFNSGISVNFTDFYIIIVERDFTNQCVSFDFDGGTSTNTVYGHATTGTRTTGPHLFSYDGNNPLTGEFAELLIYERLLTVPEKLKLQGYAAHKWGLTSKFPSVHQYKNAIPTLND